MKKLLLLCFTILLTQFLSAQNYFDSLYGIWEGKDRFVFFEKNDVNDNPQISIVLKEYYGWYYDRAVEPSENSRKESRIRNTGTSRAAEEISVETKPLSKTYKNSCFELILNYSRTQKNNIPVLIYRDNIFINYYVQDSENLNYYRGNVKNWGMNVSPFTIPDNLSCLYFSDNKYFDIRYWLTDMDYADEKVSLSYEDAVYSVDKHINSCGFNYSCVSGRSKNIRNVVEPVEYELSDFNFIENNSIIICDKEPYLTKIADKRTFEELMQIVKDGNSRRKPDPEPIFPPNNVNWHWDIIDRLEADNSIIQSVRERQRAFGLRAKNINR